MKTFIALVGLSASAVAGTTDDRVPDREYVEYAAGFAPFCARLEGRQHDGCLAVSTATIIADQWALTAGHVAHDLKSATLGGKHAATAIIVHPEFDASKLGWNDIAMIRIDGSFGLPRYPSLGTDADTRIGDTVTLAGYGCHGKMSTGYTDCDGRLRAGTNVIARLERTLIVCTAGGASPLEYCISPGDSGGPMFSAGRDGKLVGIASFTMADKGPLRSRRGEEMGHTRVALFAEWIRGVMGDAK